MSPRKKGSRSPKSEETRRRIYDAALGLFRRKGYQHTTMREIAREAGVAAGAAYYYFDSKEALVLVFYRQLLAEEPTWLEHPRFKAARDLKTRVHALITLKFDQLERHEKMLEGVFLAASDPASPLSPFSDETRDVREGNVRLFRQAVELSHDGPSDLRERLPRLLWLYQMALIQFWFHDRSQGRQRARQLLERTLGLLTNAIRVLSLPLAGPLRRTAIEVIDFLYESFGAGSAR